MGMRKREKHFLENNPEYIVIYYALLKEARVWNGSGQYWLGKESEKRAKYLLEGDIKGYEKVPKSEKLFYKTKRF